MCEHKYMFFSYKNFKQKFYMIDRNHNYNKIFYVTRRISEKENRKGV